MAGRRSGLLVNGLPLLKPPYGVITAVEMNRGEIVWQIPHGQTPDRVRRNPALEGIDLPRTGQSASVGTLVTKTLLIAGEAEMTTGEDGASRAMLRAYDKASGEELAALPLPRATNGLPHDLYAGRRAVSGGRCKRH